MKCFGIDERLAAIGGAAHGLVLFALLLVPSGAAADAGVLEINATCAIQTGCFPSDVPGYPVTITNGAGAHRFRLTSDLTVPTGTLADAISVSQRDTSLDLRGFRIATEGCLATPGPGCDPGGQQAGIRATPGASGLAVRNGSIVGFGASGIVARDRLTLMRVDLRWNGDDGVESGDLARIDRSRAIGNGRGGFALRRDAIIRRSLAHANAGVGIGTLDGSVVESNSTWDNALAGFFVTETVVRSNVSTGNGSDVSSADQGMRVVRGVVEGNVVLGNEGNGVECLLESVVRHNVASGNGDSGLVVDGQAEGNVARSNGLDGLSVGVGRAHYNALRENGRFGLTAAVGVAYRDNTMSGSVGAEATGGGIDLGGNSCNGAACP